MTYDVALCHPDEITKISSLSHPDDLAIPSISSGWLIVDTLCHPDDLLGVGISSGWVTANSLCHPDDILFHFMSSGWLNWGWFLIRMSYGNAIMSSGWDMLPFLSHPDEIANFDFPHHAVALQRFRNIQISKIFIIDIHTFEMYRYMKIFQNYKWNVIIRMSWHDRKSFQNLSQDSNCTAPMFDKHLRPISHTVYQFIIQFMYKYMLPLHGK